MIRTVFALLTLAAAAALSACNGLPDPVYVEETPVGSDTWVETQALPDWIEAPPARDGHARFVSRGRSNIRNIVVTGGGPLDERAFARGVTAALEPVVAADEAARLAALARTRLVLVHRAAKDEVLTREMVPGNTLSTVWALWELPLAPLVETVAEPHRDAVRTALRTAQFQDPLTRD